MKDLHVSHAQVIRFDVEDGSIYLDCVAESGEPFSVVVASPSYCWRLVGLATLERWAHRSAPLRLTRVNTESGWRLSLCDGSTRAVFDLLAEYPPQTPTLGDPAA